MYNDDSIAITSINYTHKNHDKYEIETIYNIVHFNDIPE